MHWILLDKFWICKSSVHKLSEIDSTHCGWAAGIFKELSTIPTDAWHSHECSDPSRWKCPELWNFYHFHFGAVWYECQHKSPVGAFPYLLSCPSHKISWQNEKKRHVAYGIKYRIMSWEAQGNVVFVLLIPDSLNDFILNYLCLHFSAFWINIISVYLSNMVCSLSFPYFQMLLGIWMLVLCNSEERRPSFSIATSRWAIF